MALRLFAVVTVALAIAAAPALSGEKMQKKGTKTGTGCCAAMGTKSGAKASECEGSGTKVKSVKGGAKGCCEEGTKVKGASAKQAPAETEKPTK